MRTLVVLLLLLCAPGAIGADAEALYVERCAACHGAQAEGNRATFSPNLAGQNAAYLREQLLAYQRGRRGTHVDDVQGQVMRALTEGLSVAQIDDLSSYLAALESPVRESDGDADGAGAALYRDYCSACHGQRGTGAESIFVPNLRILSSWYLEAQLFAYEKGWRGGATGSTRARNMRSIGGQLPDRHEREAIIEHLAGPLRSND